MAKTKEKNKARTLRKKGRSVKEIAKKLKVSKGIVSIWCRDIELGQKQIERLQERMIKGSYKGRLKGARVQLERRLRKIDQFHKEGHKLIGSLLKKDLLLIGIGLYWGEGSKQGRARITNSDPEIIKFMMDWFKNIWGIPKEQFSFQVLVNKIHKHRVPRIEKYWSDITGISKKQFTKTTLIKSKNKKIYKDSNNYFGTLAITIRKGTDLRYKIEGLIFGIKNSRCSSVVRADSS